ncbi:hypothetical protein HMPREF9551_05597 [Escherichia coli MS 196-1]|nr:hypothetical protein HMPREF9551_05597 [Escherichia coli MS 196-1]
MLPRQHHQQSLFSLHPLCSLGAKYLPYIISYPVQLDAADLKITVAKLRHYHYTEQYYIKIHNIRNQQCP